MYIYVPLVIPGEQLKNNKTNIQDHTYAYIKIKIRKYNKEQTHKNTHTYNKINKYI